MRYHARSHPPETFSGVSVSMVPLDNELVATLTAARSGFIASFPDKLATMRRLHASSATEAPGPSRELAHVCHQMAGLAGIVGLPRVGEIAKALEEFALAPGGPSRREIEVRLDDLAAAFDEELSGPQPEWAAPQAPDRGISVLVAEDDPDQRAHMEVTLRSLGYSVKAVARGQDVLPAARLDRPGVVMLDIDLGDRTGFEVCRQLKATPEFRGIPVMFVTARASLPDRVTGLTLGADDYLNKPVDRAELDLRLRNVLRRTSAAVDTASEGLMDYAAFAAASAQLLAAGAASVALIRIPRGRLALSAPPIVAELRRKDLLGKYDDSHLALLLPGLDLGEAQVWLDSVLTRIADGGEQIFAGLAASADAGLRPFEALIQEADEALILARHQGRRVATRADETAPADPAVAASVLIAEDDPDIARLVDATFRAAGYRTSIAFDGAAALQGIRSGAPDVAVIDLMMPKLTGFDVLQELRKSSGPRPRIVVVSARGREADTVRAFELGADDYMTKPFSPQELLPRVARLLR